MSKVLVMRLTLPNCFNRRPPYPLLICALFFLLLYLSGCVVGPDYEPPEIETPSAYINETGVDASPPMYGWRDLFGSPELNELLDIAEANNHDLKAAWQAVLVSRAILGRSRSDNIPDLDAGIGGNYFKNSNALSSSGVGSSGERYDADITARWEIDLFGSIRRSIQAAEANLDAQEALYQDLMFTLQADVALHYFQINSLQAEIELLERSRDTRRQSLELIEERFNTGTISELRVAQTTSLAANAESRLYATLRRQNSLIYSLATLLGETPATFDYQPKALETEPPLVPAGLPGELLTRRPDIRRAERLLAAANEQVGVAVASYFPSINLSGTLGRAANDWDELFDSNARYKNFRPTASVPIFLGGRLRAEEDRARAQYEQRLQQYKQTVIEAVTEVEDILQSLNLLNAQIEAIALSVESSNVARRISILQYERGLSDFITALDAERTALNAEQQLVQLKRSQFLDTIDLVRALGGAW